MKISNLSTTFYSLMEMIPAKKYYYLFIFFSILFSTNTHASDQSAVNGVLDLREWNYEESEIIELKGEWNFYWKELLTLSDIEDSTRTTSPSLITASQTWTNFGYSSHGHATYHLKILLPPEVNAIGLRASITSSASKIFVGDQLFSETGKVTASADEFVPFIKSKIVYIPVSASEVDLIVQIGNYVHERGGMIEMFTMSTPKNIIHDWSLDIMVDLFLFGALLIMGLYHFGIYILRKKELAPLFFALFCIDIAVRIIFTGNYFINELGISGIGYETLLRINYLTFYMGGIIFTLFSYFLFPIESSLKFVKFATVFSSISTLVVLLTKSSFYSTYLFIYQIFALILGIYFTYVLIKASIYKRQGANIFLGTWILLFICIIYDILAVRDIVPDGDYAATGLFIFIFAQSYLLSSRFSDAFTQNEHLTEELNYTNQNLELLVDEKTQSLKEANDQLSVQHQNIQDSIKYAKRIQDSILTKQLKIEEQLKDGFIFFKPRDIVSGDFYWVEKVQNKTIVVAADCTGHGVPGAFMSLIGFEALNQVVLYQNILDPKEILENVHFSVRRSLNQEDNAESRDGMDMAICVIDHENQTLKFGGAKRPLYMVKDGSLNEIKGDNLPIGGQFKGTERKFTTHDLKIDPDTTYFISSDGYQDQFGGKDDRKFMVGKFKKLLVSIATEKGEKQRELLERRFKSWRRGMRQIDDVLVIGFKA